MGGKGGGGGSEAIAREQAAIARQLLGETQGLRHGAIGELEGVLGFPQTDFTAGPATGGDGRVFRSAPVDVSRLGHKLAAQNPFGGGLRDPGFGSLEEVFAQAGAIPAAPEAPIAPAVETETQDTNAVEQPPRDSGIFQGVFRPARESLEQQFANARESVLSNVPARGGQLNQLLSDVALGRAQSVGSLEGELLGRAFDTASSISLGQVPQQGLAGLGSAAGLLGAAEAQRAQSSAAKGSAIGTLGGAAFGGALGGPAGAKAGTSVGGTVPDIFAGINRPA